MDTEPAFTPPQRLEKATRAAGSWQQTPKPPRSRRLVRTSNQF
ncbi:hypothetical protein [Leptolyngbya sp. FACHB-36]|nr:hypothetical protein [Leptolyngbya sp. FACHB-36]